MALLQDLAMLAVQRDLKGFFKGIYYIYIYTYIDVEGDVDIDSCFGCLKGGFKFSSGTV